jgi:hypothetical protein
MAQFIQLTRGQQTLVDDDTFAAVGHLKWCAQWNPYTRSYYAVRSVNKKAILLHRLILGLSPGDPRKGDHANLDTLDNQRSNLRIATKSQNGANRRLLANNKSGFKGVSWSKRSRRWKSQIRKGKVISLGYFDDPREAAKAYDSAALKLHGEFARLNFRCGADDRPSESLGRSLRRCRQGCHRRHQ